ncbi:hypothetical protein M404DRAFT_20459 [Pisolithus tinctorius Marx 270]|uniref:Uncharacterized protein n=1 Tax=Pisolithus tinctorius Marx 270 TaxID=870435 RepID=A0A0C3JRV3_PISTI|nr:hypothetical protein M404DRAFT_20459 [Pisolithus tinctorius Marx 270]
MVGDEERVLNKRINAFTPPVTRLVVWALSDLSEHFKNPLRSLESRCGQPPCSTLVPRKLPTLTVIAPS